MVLLNRGVVEICGWFRGAPVKFMAGIGAWLSGLAARTFGWFTRMAELTGEICSSTGLMGLAVGICSWLCGMNEVTVRICV